MQRWAAAILCLLPQALFAGCLSLVEPPLESDCTKSVGELTWRNPAHLLRRVKLPPLPYDRQLYDAALSQGLSLAEDLEFELRVPTPHLVEIFIASDQEEGSVALEVDGKDIDSRVHTAPAGEWQSLELAGILRGSFKVRASGRFVLSAIRWTPQAQFEERLAPAWLERARQLSADPFFEDLKTRRRDSLEQIYERLALSTRPQLRREAVIGKARMAYWLAAETHYRGDIDRASTVLREAFALAPDDRILRQVVSSSCAERNVAKGSRMPYGAFCIDAAPVPWSVTMAPDPEDAPEWATTERRLAARLDAITRWWVERRQKEDGEIGGGLEGDLSLARQWKLQAVALGSAAATAGVVRFGDGSVPEQMPPAPPPPFGERMPLEVLWNMVSLAKDSEKTLSRDFDMYTSEAIYTDRVYYPVTAEYWRYLVGGEGSNPPAVSWPVSKAEFARAVLASSPAALKLRLYSFEGRPASAVVLLRGLQDGAYRWETADVIGTQLASGAVTLTPRARTLSIPLPPGREIEVNIRQVNP